ncbi:hypothetical protein D9758_003402 [Tetrapyrgos nigripes]|uniref:Glycoside hydrolase family 5 domain-containing protein n=1 Tax=Tetrapyrgos nigripes TaxID=182062 RepID=A0A8H5GVA1_9AGAR|nr:hypothetical protein D9758_003402 [Tetrapyrgos nigripes]
MRSVFSVAAGLSCLSLATATAIIPDKIYGVNLGSWLLLESWMLPGEWLQMGGEQCNPCSSCIATEFAFAQAYPDTVDQKFEEHWNTWFTGDDVNQLKDLGINTARIPLGYWIIEPLVDRKTEFYPRGGIHQLRRGLKQLKDAGIVAILDHHALPGVAADNQQFAGQCTNTPQFYTDYNYNRALVWAAVMTGLSHLHPDFSSVFAIEAANEPLMNATLTPGYGDYQKKFVQTVRAMESLLGIRARTQNRRASTDSSASFNATEIFNGVSPANCRFTGEICKVILEALPILVDVSLEVGGFDLHSVFGLAGQPQLMTNFMDVSWQSAGPAANPADAAMGPQGYDNHLYYVFGGVADPNPKAYMTSICNLQRVQNAQASRNIPLWFGEWGLPTQFSATDAFLRDWADAQKLAYTKGAGWIFWNFKVEISEEAGDLAREWSYMEGVKRGYLTRDPAALHNPNVCDPYIN